MTPFLVTAFSLLGSTLLTLQAWQLKELYAIRVALTRNEERHEALASRVAHLESRR